MKYIKTLGKPEKPEEGFLPTKKLSLEALVDEVWKGFRLRHVMGGEFHVSLGEDKMTVLFSIRVDMLPEEENQESIVLARHYSLRELRYQFEQSTVIALSLIHI